MLDRIKVFKGDGKKYLTYMRNKHAYLYALFEENLKDYSEIEVKKP